MEKLLTNSWQTILSDEFTKPYYQKLWQFLEQEFAHQTVYPKKEQIFAALNLTPYEDVKVVILGQDPYHGPNQAHGLAFSVQPGVKTPPSLQNIYKEMVTDLGCQPVAHGNLTSWAQQGVLLLNTVLTVRSGAANSHQGKGWEQFTDEIIRKLNQREEPVVFVLWGKPAQTKVKMIDTKKHPVITAPHPSPLSAYRGFFGSKPFSKANAALEKLGKAPIAWCLPDVAPVL